MTDTLPTPRHNQWTQKKLARFLRELAASQSVSHAAKAVGMSRQSAYRAKAQLAGTPFAFGWEVALEAGMNQLAHAMMDRAINGVEVPHYYQGELIGTSRRYDERLAVWVASHPWKVGRAQFAREAAVQKLDLFFDRVENGPIDWTDEEMEAGDSRAAEELRDGGDPKNFLDRDSWYAAELAYAERHKRML